MVPIQSGTDVLNVILGGLQRWLSTYCSYKGPMLGSQHPNVNLQLLLIPVPGGLVSFSDLCRHQA